MSKPLSVTLLLALALLAGCDTSARISFQDVKMSAARTTGFLPQAGSCSTPGGNLVGRFVLQDTEGGVIREGAVAQGKDVVASSVSLNFENGSATSFLDDTCQSGVNCPSGLTCNSTSDQCQLNSLTLNSGEATFLSDNNSDKVIGLLLPVSSSEKGKIPNQYLLGKFSTPDGTTVIRDASQNQGQGPPSIDDQGGLRQMISVWGVALSNIDTKVKADIGKSTYVGLYAYSSSVTPNDEKIGVKIFPKGTRSLPNASTASNATASLFQTYLKAQNLDGVLNVFDAIKTVASDPVQDGPPTLTTQSGDRILIVVVSGPDGKRTPPKEAIEKAKSAGVRLFFLQFDPPLAQADQNRETINKLYPDYPLYYSAQTKNCSSDADCYAYERCGFPMLYEAGQSGTKQGGISEGKKCLVNRSITGQVGPIDTYSQAACETGGGYIYLPESPAKVDLYELVNWLPWAAVGLWEVPLTSSNTNFSADGRYLVSGKATLSLGGEGDPVSQNFAPPINNQDVLSTVQPTFVFSPKTP